MEVPPELLSDDDAAHFIEQAIEQASEVDRLIGFAFDRHFRPRRSLVNRVDQRVVRFKTLRARMSADYWQRLAPLFRRFIADLTDESKRAESRPGWVATIIQVAQRAFDQAVEQSGERADALRTRVLAQDACRYQLAVKRKEWDS